MKPYNPYSEGIFLNPHPQELELNREYKGFSLYVNQREIFIITDRVKVSKLMVLEIIRGLFNPPPTYQLNIRDYQTIKNMLNPATITLKETEESHYPYYSISTRYGLNSIPRNDPDTINPVELYTL